MCPLASSIAITERRIRLNYPLMMVLYTANVVKHYSSAGFLFGLLNPLTKEKYRCQNKPACKRP